MRQHGKHDLQLGEGYGISAGCDFGFHGSLSGKYINVFSGIGCRSRNLYMGSARECNDKQRAGDQYGFHKLRSRLHFGQPVR